MLHKPVLLKETIEYLNLSDADIVFDGTLGSGGHAKEILKFIPCHHYIATDLDKNSIEIAKRNMGDSCDIQVFNLSFEEIDKILRKLQIGCVNKILLDLGWSQDQFETFKKGFSFNKDEELLMTYKDPEKAEFTAKDIVNTWSQDTIELILSSYGEERRAKKIAEAIVKYRNSAEIRTSKELADIVRSVYRVARGKIDPATKTFQALRIAANNELQVLENFLQKANKYLCSSGRLAIISFHSLEDRLVKRYFADWEKQALGKRVNKKPISASKEELSANRRARSAKLRVYEKF